MKLLETNILEVSSYSGSTPALRSTKLSSLIDLSKVSNCEVCPAVYTDDRSTIHNLTRLYIDGNGFIIDTPYTVFALEYKKVKNS